MEKSKKQEAISLMTEIEKQLAEYGSVVRNEIDENNFYDTDWLCDLCKALVEAKDRLSSL